MRKNNMLRLASVLLVAVLLSTCVVSGVFANYRTTGSTTDSARVAKWGVTIDATTDTIGNVMFSDSYKDAGTVYDASEEGADITVQADTEGTNVVAPGTNGALAQFDIAGTPEVDVRVTYTPDLVLSNWEINGTTCPIVFYVNTVEFKVGGVDLEGNSINNAAALEAAVEAAIGKATAVYDANTDLSCVEDDLTVTWKWVASTTEDDIANDTALGNAAAGLALNTDGKWVPDGTGAAKAATIALTVGVSIDQID